jgi:uncharacterized protein (DUF885 family)
MNTPTTIAEAIPDHWLQTTVQMGDENLPLIRRHSRVGVDDLQEHIV